MGSEGMLMLWLEQWLDRTERSQFAAGEEDNPSGGGGKRDEWEDCRSGSLPE